MTARPSFHPIQTESSEAPACVEEGPLCVEDETVPDAPRISAIVKAWAAPRSLLASRSREERLALYGQCAEVDEVHGPSNAK